MMDSHFLHLAQFSKSHQSADLKIMTFCRFLIAKPQIDVSRNAPEPHVIAGRPITLWCPARFVEPRQNKNSKKYLPNIRFMMQ